MKIDLKARNVPKLLGVGMPNVTVFSGILAGVVDVRNVEALRIFLSEVATDPQAGLPYAGLLTVVRKPR